MFIFPIFVLFQCISGMLILLPTGKLIPTSSTKSLKGFLMKPSALEGRVGDDGCKGLGRAVDFKVKTGQGRVQLVPWIALITDAEGKCSLKHKSEQMKASGASMLVLVTEQDHYSVEGTALPVVFIKPRFLKEIEGVLQKSAHKLAPVKMINDGNKGVMPPVLLILAFLTPAVLFFLAMIVWQWISDPDSFSESESQSLLFPLLTPADEQPASLEAVTALPCYPHCHGGGFASECAICLEEFGEGVGVRRVPCGHEFHPHCVDPWLLTKKRKCPVCRKLIEPEEFGNGREEEIVINPSITMTMGSASTVSIPSPYIPSTSASAETPSKI